MSLVETDIGTIAPDWKLVPLKDVAEKPQYGLTAKAAKSGDTRVLRITDITEQGVNWATVPFCSAPKKKIDPCHLKSGDIVFARIGATTGKSYMITDPPDAVFASYLIRVRAGEDLEPGFLIELPRFKADFPNEREAIQLFEQVNLMTPENIHLNSFMYEPILDMAADHLKKLYQKLIAMN